ncbi:MAG: hypothetical protein JWR51_4706 [Devosia sp.]|uniref:DNA transfer protein p32 n=1 Tax=Devosia sp. TaxID=1871048 RepID=UPI0026154356|nr:DNA transfer protein p32 [Devosia sp.]MDB5531603.1 hypothetical protein [Devosia sp.]
MPVGAVVGGVLGAGASLVGSGMQAKATKDASKVQSEMYEKTRGDLAPYRTAGEQGTNALMAALPDLNSKINLDQAWLEQTPGYQFNKAQGLKAVQNSAAARGLGTSGAALKGAAGYATGLADSTYQTQFGNEMAQRDARYNRLMGVSSLGQNAAAQTGNFGTQTAQSIGQNTIAGGTAQAAGLVGAGNALMGGAQNYLGYNLGMQQLGNPTKNLWGVNSGTGGYTGRVG